MSNINLGNLKGKVLVFGGVYSNLQALEELKKIAESLQIAPENIICTGDIVGYCASPTECLELIEKWGVYSIQGNVEQNLLNGTDDCGCNFEEGSRCDIFSKMWFPYAVSKMKKSNYDYLNTLPLSLEFAFAGKNVSVIHGSALNISEFVFESAPWVVKAESFQITKSDVILAGHAGLPFFEKSNNKLWLNSGVIGMPANDGTSRVWYAVLDDSDNAFNFEICSFEYDSFEANQLMLESGLPFSYAETLLSGIWDNNEILPDQETAREGIPYNFNQIPTNLC